MASRTMIEDMAFSVRSYNALKNANVNTMEELQDFSEAQLLKTKNFGRHSLREIEAISCRWARRNVPLESLEISKAALRQLLNLGYVLTVGELEHAIETNPKDWEAVGLAHREQIRRAIDQLYSWKTGKLKKWEPSDDQVLEKVPMWKKKEIKEAGIIFRKIRKARVAVDEAMVRMEKFCARQKVAH